jgi:FixJ family two-component response regulator
MKLKHLITSEALQHSIVERVSWSADYYGAGVERKESPVAEGVIISVVDDDESVRKAIKRLIKSVGISVNDFASAEDFLSSGLCEEAACLILDVRLPGMSGLELQSQLIASNCTVPIIFISAHDDGQDEARALKAGAIDFLQKPFSEVALFHAINLSLVIYRNDTSDASNQDEPI